MGSQEAPLFVLGPEFTTREEIRDFLEEPLLPELTPESDLVDFIRKRRQFFLESAHWNAPDFLRELNCPEATNVLGQAKEAGADVDFEDFQHLPEESRLILGADRVLTALFLADRRIRREIRERCLRMGISLREDFVDGYQVPFWLPVDLIGRTLTPEED